MPLAEKIVSAAIERGIKNTLESVIPKDAAEAKGKLENRFPGMDVLYRKMGDILSKSPAQLEEQVNRLLDERARQAQEYSKEDTEGQSEGREKEETKEGLTDEEKKRIKEETGWSDEIIDAIGSMEEYEIYKDAGLVEAEINGKKCLIRSDIDLDQKDEFGRTNRERMEKGNPPITKNGETVELHHIGQKADSPLAELTTQEHRGKGNDTILHDKLKESEIDRTAFANERKAHWKARPDQG